MSFPDDLDNRMPQLEALVAARLPDLTSALGQAVAGGITERHLIPILVSWRDGELATLNDATAAYEARVQEDAATAVAARLTEWQAAIIPELEELTRPLCDRWGLAAQERILVPPVHDHALAEEFDAIVPAPHVIAILTFVMFGPPVVSWPSPTPPPGPLVTVVGFVAAALWLISGPGTDRVSNVMDANTPVQTRKIRSEAKLCALLRERAAGHEAELAASIAAAGTKCEAAIVADASRAIRANLELRAAEAGHAIA